MKKIILALLLASFTFSLNAQFRAMTGANNADNSEQQGGQEIPDCRSHFDGLWKSLNDSTNKVAPVAYSRKRCRRNDANKAAGPITARINADGSGTAESDPPPEAANCEIRACRSKLLI